VPGVLVHLHLHEHVAREELALALAALSVPHLDDFLGRDQDLAELVLEPVQPDAFPQALGDLVLEIRVGVNDIPA
jgi:hypothetical protein